MARQIFFHFEEGPQNETAEKSLLKEIELLKSALANERNMWAEHSQRSRENAKECEAKLDRMKEMLTAYDNVVIEREKMNEKTSMKLRGLESENQTLSLSLREEKKRSALVQMELSDLKKMLQHLQDDFENLQEDHKEVTALLEREIMTNGDLQLKIKYLVEKTVMIEKTCQTSQGDKDEEENPSSQKLDSSALEDEAVLSAWKRFLLFFICGSDKYHF